VQLKARVLSGVVAVAIVLAIGSSASAYRWVAYRQAGCGGVDTGGLRCNAALVAQPNPAVCHAGTVNLVAVCDDSYPPVPAPAGCHFVQCPYGDLPRCVGPAAASNAVFVCKR
jgi:hypothetical protein